MKKLSIKIGAIFFLCILGLEAFMFIFLHSALVDSRIKDELNALQIRGNAHRAILLKHFNEETIAHVALMETESNTEVIITDENLQILDASNDQPYFNKYIKTPDRPVPINGDIVAKDWQHDSYIATISPIVNGGETMGYVFMLQNTDTIHSVIKRLNQHFLLVGFLTIVFTFSLIAILSKALTKPLIDMKDATYQLSQGNYTISLPTTGDDELGDLATSIKKLANELNYLTKERSDFLASISHELRTPLTYIKGYSEIALRKELSNENRNNYLQIIHEESNRLNGLIKNLFELAKIDRNTFHIEKSWLNLTALIHKVEQTLKPAFLERNMLFAVDCPPDLYLLADSVRIEQILLNLLDNAMKYSIEGKETTLTVTSHTGDIVIQVRDRGKGIPENELPRIFDRFYRVDKSRTRALGGSGLGLSIVKELVLAHNGTIEVESSPDHGTTFTIQFKGGRNHEDDTFGG